MESQLSATTLLITISVYFLILMILSQWTSKNADSQTFFTAKRDSPWPLVAFGMIGASLSGVTFLSVPGAVGAGGLNMAFSYMQMVMGYILGYAVIALFLMPLYYRYNTTTIYGYLEQRFGTVSYKSGSLFFLLSRIMGASLRLFLVAMVLQQFVFNAFGVPFWLTVFLTILLIWIYTYQGGIKTIVWTDTLQTVCMLGAVILTIMAIGETMNLDWPGMIEKIKASEYSKVFFFEGGWSDGNNFYKQFISGALVTIVMTGLDQDMMQKNLTCRSLGDAQKNVAVFSVILVFANLLFLSLGALLYMYAHEMGISIPEKSDQLFPTIALQYLSPTIGLVFIIGLMAAAYSTADSALTSLTTAFCIDFLNFEKRELSEEQKKSLRLKTHLGFSFILFFIVVLVEFFNQGAILNTLFKVAGLTYGPILGLFTFGLFTTRKITDRHVWIICLLCPIISYIINKNSAVWFDGFQFGHTLIALNGLLTFIGLLMISKK